jgi:hypothetical protein
MHWRALALKDVPGHYLRGRDIGVSGLRLALISNVKGELRLRPRMGLQASGNFDPICFKKGAETGDGQSGQPVQH